MKFYYPIFSFFVLFIFTLFPSQTKATHVIGSDISYACTGTPGVYEITLIIFRNCGGGASTLCPTTCGAPCPQTMQLQGADPSCASFTYGSISLALVSVRDADAKPQCPSAKNTCNNMGCTTAGTYTPAVERYEFKGMANIGPSSGIPATCCNVRFSWELCCRNSNIATGAADANYYVDAVINRCLSVTPCNSSPVFGADPYITVCGGENVVYNNATYDPDGDSLTFAFTPALAGFGNPVPYTPPFTFDKPMPWSGPATGVFPAGIHCDPINGDIMFTPPPAGSLFSGVIAIEVKQWKKVNSIPTVIGVTRRDIQMVVRGDCAPNNPPRFVTVPSDTPNINIPKTTWEICEGEPLCFTIIAKDTDFNLPTVSDTTYLSWDATLAQYGATFLPNYNQANRKDTITGGPREDSYQFCWTPPQGSGRDNPYLFSVAAIDNKCPNPGRLRRGFSVKVNPLANITITKTNKNCGKWQVGYTKNIPSQTFTSTSIQISKEPGDYTFTAGSTVHNNITTTPVLTFKKGGKYLIKVTAILGNCPKVFIDTLVVDTPLTLNGIDTIACSGTPATVSISATNGLAPYTYRWYNNLVDSGMPPLNGPDFSQPHFTITATTPKYYYIIVRDLAGCSTYDSAKVFVTNHIQQAAVTHVKCNGENNGSIVITPVGPISAFQFKLNSGAFQASNSFNNLTAGTYTVTVKDSNNCNSIQTIVVKQPAVLKDTFSTVTSQTCIGLTNGSILTTAKGGTAPYKFSKDSVLFDTTRSFTSLIPGIYKIHILDSNQCYTSFTKTVLAADTIKYTTTVKSVLCSGNANGEIKISATGGKKPFTYKLGTGAFVTDSVFKNLAANAYNLTIKDANSCIVSFTDSVKSPAPLQHNTVGKNPNCFGANNGSIIINAIGGTPPYLYKQIFSSLYDTVSQYNNLSAGTYALALKDKNNCSLSISKTIQHPAVINGVIVAQATTCNETYDGKITITTTGGVPPYTYSLNSSAFTATNQWTNLGGGAFQIIIKDSLLCQKTLTTSITQTPKVVVSITKTAISCFSRADGSIIATPIVGRPPFTYNINGGPYTSTPTFTGLSSNMYVIGLKDSLGCKDSVLTIMQQPSQIIAGSITGPATSSIHQIDTYSVATQPGMNYLWFSQKGIFTTAPSSATVAVRWDSVGTGYVSAYVYNDITCGDTTTMAINIGSVGLSELSQSWGLNVYPNPAKNILNIQLQKLPEQTQIQLYDVQGKLVLQQELKLSQQLNIETLTPGMYLLKIGAWSGQVVKE